MVIYGGAKQYFYLLIIGCQVRLFVRFVKIITGWCYACKLKAQKDEPGYCGGEEDHNSRQVKSSSDWGWCDHDCAYRPDQNPSSQQALFVAVDIISQPRCVIYIIYHSTYMCNSRK